MSEVAPSLERRAGKLRRLDCPNCGGNVEIRANGISITAICPSCGSTLDVAGETVTIIAETRRNTRDPLIPIGARGTLSGTEWEVIGFQERSNPKQGWSWDEFLLFNPYRGFRFLAHDDTGWTLFCMLRQDVADPAQIAGDTHKYGTPDASQARTDYVLGEFYWRVRVGDVAEIEERTAGDWSLVKETGGDEIVWSRGRRLPSKTVLGAFPMAVSPEDRARASTRACTRSATRVGLLALAVLVVLSLINLGGRTESVVLQDSETATASTRGRPIVTAPFTVPDASGNLQVSIHAPVRNNWVSVAVSLAPEGGGPSYDAVDEIEYYTGYDSDGSWSEGGEDGSVLFRNVPGGVYRLLLDVDAGAFSAGSGDRSVVLGISLRRHVPASEFFWFALLLILPYPLFRWFFRRGRA